jgi:hypothetical protein
MPSVKLIDEALMEKTCREVADLDDPALASRMEALAQRQPDLLAFVMAAWEDLNAEAAELGIYVFFVVYQVFEHAAGVKLKKVSQTRILTAEEHTEELLNEMGDGDEAFHRSANAECSAQPTVIAYIVDVIGAYGDEENETRLSNEENWLLFCVLNTVVDVLDGLE